MIMAARKGRGWFRAAAAIVKPFVRAIRVRLRRQAPVNLAAVNRLRGISLRPDDRCAGSRPNGRSSVVNERGAMFSASSAASILLA